MFEVVSNLVFAFLDAIGFSGFLYSIFPQPDAISALTSYDFFMNASCVVLSFVVIWVVFRLFVGIINKFIEVIKYD